MRDDGREKEGQVHLLSVHRPSRRLRQHVWREEALAELLGALIKRIEIPSVLAGEIADSLRANANTSELQTYAGPRAGRHPTRLVAPGDDAGASVRCSLCSCSATNVRALPATIRRATPPNALSNRSMRDRFR